MGLILCQKKNNFDNECSILLIKSRFFYVKRKICFAKFHQPSNPNRQPKSQTLNPNLMRICSLKNLKAKDTDLDQYFQANSVSIDPLQLYDITGKQGWFIGNPAEFQLKKKIESNGKPLKDWDIKINYGIKTGLNEAFIINTAKRDELIQLDPKSADIIKPILRGRDIKRYGYQWADLWIIATFPALKINIDDYPTVKQFLIDFGKDRLEQSGTKLPDGTKSRKKTGNKWFETQDQIGYHAEFNKEKVVYSEIVQEPQFYLDTKGEYFAEATTFLMTGERLRLVMAILHSKAGVYFFKNYYAGGGLGENGFRYKKVFLENLPIPILDTIHKQELAGQIEALVEQILMVKLENPHLEGVATQTTGVLEVQIDQLVYQLYDLTVEEIGVVEG